MTLVTPAPPPVSSRDRHFLTDHLQADLKGRSVRGGAATLAGQAANFALKLGATVVLARLLTPADFGLIAMVTAVTGFVALFKDAGLSMATVQGDRITHAQVSTLFWINVALSLLLMLLTAAAAPVVAWFYGEPRLVWITVALASTFVFGGLTVQHQALLARQMRFGTLAAIGVAANAAGIVAALAAAVAGLTYWALVLMTAATAVTNAALVWCFSPWLPGGPSRGTGVRSMLAFGGNLTGFTFVNYLARNADNVLIGWYWGASALGLYSRAYQLLLLPLQQISTPVALVAVPAMSRLQGDAARRVRYYVHAVSLITLLTAPISALCFVVADDLILALLGRQWGSAAPVFRCLAVSALVQPLCNSTGWLFVSAGRTDRMLRWGLFASLMIMLSFLAGLPFGALGVATSYAVVVLALTWPCLAYACADSSLRPYTVIRALAPQVTGATAAAIVAWVARTCILPELSAFSSLCATGGLFAVTYVSYLACFPSVRAVVRSMLGEQARQQNW